MVCFKTRYVPRGEQEMKKKKNVNKQLSTVNCQLSTVHCRFILVFQSVYEPRTIMDSYVKVGNNVSSVIRSALTVKKLFLQQKRCLDELTKQRSSLQQQTHKLKEESNMLVKKNVSLQNKLKKLEDLNKSYSHIISDLSFNEDNDPGIPTTPERSTKHMKRNPKKKEQMLDNIVTPDTPTKRKHQQSNDNQPQLRRSVRMKGTTSTKKK